MCFEKYVPAVCLVSIMMSCSSQRLLKKTDFSEQTVTLSIPGDEAASAGETAVQSGQDSIAGRITIDETDGPIIMRALKEEETGEMVAVDVISASKVTARFRNVAERLGMVEVEFDISVPEKVIDSEWRLKFYPVMKVMDDIVPLEPFFITGTAYREEQLKGYRKYRAFLETILTDSTDFIRNGLLRKFVERNISGGKGVFGITRKQAMEHYTKYALVRKNDRKLMLRDEKFRHYVKDPIISEGIRLDTVMSGQNGNLVYRYVQPVRGRKGMKRIDVTVRGELYNDGICVMKMPETEKLSFYVSSLTTLVDPTPRYKTRIIGRNVEDNTYAFIDFRPGDSMVDETLPGNGDELHRIRENIFNLLNNEELQLDSIVITASCSPEGNYTDNEKLARERAESVAEYFTEDMGRLENCEMISKYIPENWEKLNLLIKNDTVMSEKRKAEILALTGNSVNGYELPASEIDAREQSLSKMREYRYLREKLYPKLRGVKFDFYLHRKGIDKDTVITSEIDSVYLSGVEALRNLDYKKALDILRQYHDYNTALAYLVAGYEESALAELENMRYHDSRSFYLLAVISARMQKDGLAVEYFRKSVRLDSSMVHRANLDPEISDLVSGIDL